MEITHIDRPLGNYARASTRGRAVRVSPRGSTPGRGQINASQLPTDPPANPASDSTHVPQHTQVTQVTPSQPLPEIRSSPAVGEKRKYDQTAAVEEPSIKKEQLTDADGEIGRVTALFKSTNPAEIAGVYPKKEKLTSFFLDFNENHPLPIQDTTHPSQIAIDIVLASWKATDGRLSLVEERQNRAEVRYKKAVEELKGSENGMQERLEFIYGWDNILINSLKRFLDDLGHQPVFEALQDAKNTIMLLMEQGDTTTSRFLAKSIARRLNRKPLLQFDFDLDRDIPGLKALMARANERLDFIPL